MKRSRHGWTLRAGLQAIFCCVLALARPTDFAGEPAPIRKPEQVACKVEVV